MIVAAEVPMKSEEVDRLRRTPAYPFIEAAHYLSMPVSTLRSWCIGQDYQVNGETRRFQPLIELDGDKKDGLSFLNLVEGHVLAAIRRKHDIPLPKVRDALTFIRNRMNSARPLLQRSFQTDGVNLFVKELSALVNVTKEGQLEMEQLLLAHLHRIERDPAGLPIRLFPFTRTGTQERVSPVQIDPTVAFGRPALRGRAVPTAVLADRFKAGEAMTVLATDFGVTVEVIEDAIRCELDRAA
jgi:uncharacterized protein (DUF433 family)